MNPLRCFPFPSQLALRSSLVLLAGAMFVQTAQADDEIRAGAVLQIPFSFSSAPDFSGIRVGLTCQYAEVEKDTITSTHHVTNTYLNEELQERSETTSVTGVDEGDQAYGVEGNVFFDILNGFTPSVEALGFYGTNDIQGAFGGGYNFSGDFFLDAKVMFPYSEIGIRFPGQTEIYGGLKTLGHFQPEQRHHLREVVTDISNSETSSKTTYILVP